MGLLTYCHFKGVIRLTATRLLWSYDAVTSLFELLKSVEATCNKRFCLVSVWSASSLSSSSSLSASL